MSIDESRTVTAEPVAGVSEVYPPEEYREVQYQTTPGYEEEELELFFPHEVVKFGLIIALVIGVLTFFATMVPMPLGVPADPLRTPPGIEPEWYFLAVYQLLKYVPRWLGVGFSFIVFPILLFGVPFVWGPVTRRRHGWLVLRIVVAVGVAISAILSIMGFMGFE
jgi:cytochrome b6-f complex subunit 4